MLAIAFGLAFYCLSWSLAPDYYFKADDYKYLYFGEYRPYSDFLNFFPKMIYNDRPVGCLINKIIYSIFGPNNVAFHALFLLVHLVNILVIFRIARRIFNDRAPAFIAALIFGGTYAALGAVTWPSAVFDLSGHTFIGLAILCFLLPGRVAAGASLLCYFLALRSKEFGLLLVVILALYEWLLVHQFRWDRATLAAVWKKTRWHWLIFAVIVACYGWLALSKPAQVPKPGDGYYQCVTLGEFYTGMKFYLGCFLYSVCPSLSRMRWTADLAVGLFFFLILFGLWRRRFPLAFGGLGFVITLLPVMFLKNHRQSLYLYDPLFFLAIFIAGLAYRPRPAQPAARSMRKLYFDATMVFAVCFALACSLHARPFSDGINFNLRWGKACYQSSVSVKTILPRVKPGTAFFVAGVPKYLNALDYGPGYYLKVFYRDPTISCQLYLPEAELIANYRKHQGEKVFLKYQKDGTLKLAGI